MGKIITLSNGMQAECRPVPPYAMGIVHQQIPEPEFPHVKVESAAGGSEELPALPGSEIWAGYRKTYEEYKQELARASLDFSLNYAVIQWRDDEEAEWFSEVPEGWTVPKILEGYGVSTSDDEVEKRVQYIKFVLIQTRDDAVKIKEFTHHKKPTSVTREEIEAAKTPFEPETPTGDR
jgi:hypothetical protein